MVILGQVTLGAGATQVTTQSIYAKWVVFQNNAAASMRLGDSTVSATRGMYLAGGPGGGTANPVPFSPVSQTNLKFWYVFGTSGQILDYAYDDGQP